MSRRCILVIEDDPAIRQSIVLALQSQRYDVIEVGRADEGLETAIRADCDLVLLDLILPGGHGLEVLQAIRESRSTLPVIVLTALGSEDDRVRGLDQGADDYVVKPFSARELLARVEAVLRRSAERPRDVENIGFPGGLVDLVRSEVRHADGGRAELSEREGELLLYLARHAGRVVSREELLSRVWGVPTEYLQTRTVDVHIARLREKLRDDPKDPRVLVTVRGKGYLFSREERQ